jgi:hypothetical protein
MAPGGLGPVENSNRMGWSCVSERTTKGLDGSLDRRIELLSFGTSRRCGIDPSDQVQCVYCKENDAHLLPLAVSKPDLLNESM